MTTHRIPPAVAVLFMLVMVTSFETQAKSRIIDTTTSKGDKHIVFIDREDFRRIVTNLGGKVHMVKLSKHDSAKLANLATKGCACATDVGENEEGKGCFKGCLESWGVNWEAMSTCLAICGLAPGSPGLVACAACLGIGEWIVAGCALYCVWSPLISENHSPGPKRHLRTGQNRLNDGATLARVVKEGKR